MGGSCPLGPQTRLRGQGPPPPQPGRLHWPTVGATVPFHRPRMLRPGIQDLPGLGQAQRCPPFWGAVLRPWRFWVSHLLALQSWRHRESCPWSGSTRYWAQISVMRAAETNSHAPPPRSLLEHPQAQGCVTSPTSPLWDPPRGSESQGSGVRSDQTPAHRARLPTDPAEQSRDPGPNPQGHRLRPAPPCPAHQGRAHIRARSGPGCPRNPSSWVLPTSAWWGQGRGPPGPL